MTSSSKGQRAGRGPESPSMQLILQVLVILPRTACSRHFQCVGFPASNLSSVSGELYLYFTTRAENITYWFSQTPWKLGHEHRTQALSTRCIRAGLRNRKCPEVAPSPAKTEVARSSRSQGTATELEFFTGPVLGFDFDLCLWPRKPEPVF